MRKSIAAAAAVGMAFAGGATAVATSPEVPEHQRSNDWYQAAAAEQAETAGQYRRPKNVMLFVGDGMGITTVTAAGILEGQLRGEPGEGNLLSFEEFPDVGLSKTYNVDSQVPDSAGTMTAMMTGVKTDRGIINLDETAELAECGTGQPLTSWIMSAEEAGMATGVVSTARLTHATPAATYAVSVSRNWENDTDVPDGCDQPDIASQLIDFPYGDGLDVALGGGRANFLPAEVQDPEDPSETGSRGDGRNLAEEWASADGAQYVWNKEQFDAVDPQATDKLLGLFGGSHVEYEHDRAGGAGDEPSLTEMTEKAIEMVQDDEDGFALMVEAGRIDHAHHGTNAYRALTDTIEFSNAVRRATEMVDLDETMIVVTADHGHVFTIAGYGERGAPILGTAGEDVHGVPYTILSYANGSSPGYAHDHDESGESDEGDGDFYREGEFGRFDPNESDSTNPDYQQQTLVELRSETHSGEDVPIYATGPFSFLFNGVKEQNYIGHVIFDTLDLAGGPSWR